MRSDFYSQSSVISSAKFNDREMSPAVGSYQRHDSELSATESLEIDRKQVKTRSTEILFEH